MLIIADKSSFRVGGERGFPCAGQAEENEGKRFIGYTLGGEDVMAGATTEETYGDRKKAVDAALTFLKGRE